MNEEFPLCPATGWETRLIPAYGAVALTLLFLASPMESQEQAHRSANFLLTALQLRELAAGILSAAQKLENAEPQGIGLSKH